MSAENSAGEHGAASPPWRARRSRSAWLFKALVTAALSFSSLSSGVEAGTKSPYHVEMLKSGTPASIIVGTLGRALARVVVVTASAMSFPASMFALQEARLSKMRSVCPASTESCAAAAPA